MSGSEELIKIETWLSDSIELSVAVPSSWPLKQVITSIRNKLTNSGIPTAGHGLFECYNDIIIRQLEDNHILLINIIEGWKKQEGYRLIFVKKDAVKPVGREEFQRIHDKFGKKKSSINKKFGLFNRESSKEEDSLKKSRNKHKAPETEDIPEVISYDDKEGSAFVRFHLATDSTFSSFSGHWTLQLHLNTTTQEICSIVAQKANLSEGSLSLYELDAFGKTHRISETDCPMNNVKKRMIHGTDKKCKFFLKRNIEHLRFYLASDQKTFWTFRITEETTVWDICETISERLFLNFEMHESNQDRVLKDDAKILFIYYSWKGITDKFVLHAKGQRALTASSRIESIQSTPSGSETESVSVSLNEGDEDVVFQIGKLSIEKNWEINLEDLSVIKSIGGGTFAKVFLGKFKGELIAIKKMINTDTYEMKKYAQREIDLLIQLDHPNIIKFIGCCQTDKAVFMVTEFVARGDLRNLLSDLSMTLSWQLRLKIAIEVASAIEHYLSKGFIHRDLKSENLLVMNDFTIKLCDFGLARDNVGRDRSMTLVGTDDWMAPEIILGEDYDQSADVFSFGMVLVEIITRLKPPLREPRNSFEFPLKEFQGNCPSDCPPKFIEITLKCIEYEPKNRPDIVEALSQLKEVASQLA